MKFFRELGHLFKYLWKTDPDDKRIVFYAEHEGYYAYFEGLLNELTRKHRVSVCYVTSDPADPVLATTNAGIKPFYLRSLLPFFMAFVKCRVFVMTLTDLDKFHLKRSMHPVQYVYIFHSMVSTHMMYRAGAFDHYDALLLVGPHHRAEIRAYEKRHDLPAKSLVDAGYYRLERIHSEFHKQTGEVSTEPTPKTVLIAPSWGEQNLLKSCGPALIENLLARDYHVIVRPHPETVRRDPQLLAGLRDTYGKRSSFKLEMSVATDDALLEADLLICDLSGVALEYALGTERPVLFIDVPPKVHNDAYRELDLEPIELALRPELGEVVSLDDLERVSDTVDRLIAECDQWRERLARLREETVYRFGYSSAIGANYIMQAVAGESPNHASLEPGDGVT